MGEYPIWLRITCFVLFSFLALFPFFLTSRRIGYLWIVSLVWGALCFGSVYLVQMPIQSYIGELFLGSDVPNRVRLFFLILPSGIVQEFFKALLPIALISIFSKSVSPKRLLGPLSGAGFGITEAILLVGIARAPIGLVAIIERFSAMLFHIGATSIAVGEGNIKRIVWALPAMMLAHSVWNFLSIVLMQKIGVVHVEIFIGVVGLGVWLIAGIDNFKGAKIEK